MINDTDAMARPETTPSRPSHRRVNYGNLIIDGSSEVSQTQTPSLTHRQRIYEEMGQKVVTNLNTSE